MTQTRDLLKKMVDFFTGEEFSEKGEDARLELSPDDVRCMYDFIKQGDKDCISRQAAINAFEKFIHELGIEDEPYNYGEMALSAQNVPSVEPERKTGKIICSNEEIKYGNIIGHVLRCKCSECNFVIDRYVAKFINYCPNCGAKIEV